MARPANQDSNDWMNTTIEPTAATDEEGQLAIDAYQTEDEIYIKAPIAGVDPQDLEIGITDEVVTIRGERRKTEGVNPENYFTQECYWGAFSRSYLLPVSVEADRAEATLKNGILTIVVPKQEKTKTRIVKVQAVS